MKASALTPEFYKEHREKVVEYIAEHDDAMLTKYLEQHKLEPAELRASLRRSTIALKLVPVLAGSAFKNKGIQPLLDAVVDYLPSPADVPPVEGTDPNGDEPILRRASDDQPFAALAFKIMTDPYRRPRDLHSRVFRRAEGRAERLQLDAKDARAHWTFAAHAREQARRDRVDRSGRHRGVRGIEECDDGRHVVR